MPIPDRLTFDSPDPRWQVRITDDGTPTLVDVASGQSMHSGCGAGAETRHVYLEGSGVAGRLDRGEPTAVLELGLGPGLGWLMTADRAAASRTPLRYLAIETELVPAAVIEALDWGRWLADPELAAAYCRWLRSVAGEMSARGDDPDRLLSTAATPRGTETVSGAETVCPMLTFRYRESTLRVLSVDAAGWLAGLGTAVAEEPFDAIYFDPYSPEASPRLWRAEVFGQIRRVLAPHGQLVTYCVSRAVRDAMGEAGLAVRRVPGPPGGKREVLVAGHAAAMAMGQS